MLAIIIAVQKWRPYLLDRKFVIRSNQRSLKFLLDQRIANPFQLRWLSKFMGFDYILEYKKGKENGAADALSRVQEGEFTAISMPIPSWLAKVREEN